MLKQRFWEKLQKKGNCLSKGWQGRQQTLMGLSEIEVLGAVPVSGRHLGALDFLPG